MARRIRPISAALALAFAMTAPALLAPPEGPPGSAPGSDPRKPPPEGPPPAERALAGAQPTTVIRVISDLTREAQASWKKDMTWPRAKSDYAQEKNVTLPSDEVLRILTRPLNRDPALEAYIKWQFMSFAPDFTKATAQDYRRLLAVMPDVIAQPKPAPPKPPEREASVGGVQRAFVSDLVPVPGAVGARPKLSVVGSDLTQALGYEKPDPYDPRFIGQTAAYTDNKLQKVRQITDAANGPVFAYRYALARELPEENGARYLMMMQDLIDRVKAGDPSTAAAAAEFVKATLSIRDARPVPETVRQQLFNGVRVLAQLQTPVAIRVRAQQGVLVSDQVLIAAPRELLAAMARNLAPPGGGAGSGDGAVAPPGQ